MHLEEFTSRAFPQAPSQAFSGSLQLGCHESTQRSWARIVSNEWRGKAHGTEDRHDTLIFRDCMATIRLHEHLRFQEAGTLRAADCGKLPMIRLMSVVGARPNFIKISPITEELKKHSDFEHRLVHSGQHYDQLLSDNFFKDLA